MSQQITDVRHMAQAIGLARRGLCTTAPNPRVGCVIAQGERVVARGFHRRAGQAHAEVEALQEMMRRVIANLADQTAQLSLETDLQA